MQINSFQDVDYLKILYDSDIVSRRGQFIKKYSNRKFSIRDIICKYFLDCSKSTTIIDIGPGNGSFLQRLYLDNRSCQLYALDIVKNKDFITNDYIKFYLYDGVRFPDFLTTFDYVFCMHMLYHVNDFDIFFHNVKKILKPTGKIIITTKSIETLPHLESVFKKIVFNCNIPNIPKLRDESNFSSENSISILNSYFPKDEYNIEKIDLTTQLIIDNSIDLYEYVFSTMRYNLISRMNKKQWEMYLAEWKQHLFQNDIFFDELKESIIIISKTKLKGEF